jgi:hypothetical protein
MSVHGYSCRLHLGPAADSTPVIAALAQGPVLAPLQQQLQQLPGHPEPVTLQPPPWSGADHADHSQENDNGICWYHNKFQHKFNKCISRCALQMKQLLHQEETAEITTTTAMSFPHGSGLFFFCKLSFLLDSRATLSMSCPALLRRRQLAQSSLGQMAPTFPLEDFKNILWTFETKLSHRIFFLPKRQPPILG